MTTTARPSLPEILRMVAGTVACQLRNSRDGRRLAELDPSALESVESQLVGNLAQLVDGLITDVTGIES